MTQEEFDKLVEEGIVDPICDNKGNTGFIYKENCFDPTSLTSDIKVNYRLLKGINELD